MLQISQEIAITGCPGKANGAHLGTTTGPRLCPKDQPQRVRTPTVVEIIPKRVAAAPLRLVLRTQPRSVSSRFWVVVSGCAQANGRGQIPSPAWEEIRQKNLREQTRQ